MNKSQKNFLIASFVAAVVCAVRVFTGAGSFHQKLIWTLVYWGEMALVFSVCLALLKTAQKKEQTKKLTGEPPIL
jgi:amino acid permease